jgi:hypothetical protein
MKRVWSVAFLLFPLGCMGSPGSPEEEPLRKLQSGSAEERDEAFQDLLRFGNSFLPQLKAGIGLGAQAGFPVVAVLYAHGEGDAVPLEFRARHLALFEWPPIHARENGMVEPYVRGQIETDLTRVGRPALRLLAQGLASDATSEARAMRVTRAMLRIGGRAAADEFARLLENKRALEGVRVCDVAAAALLYLGRQEMVLRLTPEARLQAAREWWERAKNQDEVHWTREAKAALVERWQPKDPEGILPVLELLAGERIEDPKEWWKKAADGKPLPTLLRPETLLPELERERPAAYFANHLLEQSTGVRVFMPRMERVSELCAALRLWQPPPGLAIRWKRYLEVSLLRLSIAVVGYHPQRGTNHVRWAHESYFHPLEEDSGELRIQIQAGGYVLFVQAREYGTDLTVSESWGSEGRWEETVRELSGVRPRVEFSAPFKSSLLVAVEEVSGRRPPQSPEKLQSEWRTRLKELVAGGTEAESRAALRGLGYFQDGADLDFLKERRAGEALLLLGDPAALDLHPRLEPHEIEMALRKAEDPRVKGCLEALKTGLPP